MFAQYFVQILFTLAGLLAILAALLNWDWFFTAENTRFLVKSIGRERTRLLYGILGLALIGTAVYLLFQP